jgi:replicative DNA helicase
VIGQALGKPKVLAEVVGAMLEPEHFYRESYSVIYAEMVSAYYADEPTDALSIAAACAKNLTRLWQCSAEEASAKVRSMTQGRVFSGKAVDHAEIVKRDANYRALLNLSYSMAAAVHDRQDGPLELAGSLSHEAMKIATAGVTSNELVPFDELGRRVIENQRLLQAAQEQGIELGAYFGLTFIDSFTRGLRPSELLFVAGEPGAGKSAVTWKAAQLFAERQLKKPKERQIGTLILSLEMAEEPSSMRVAQTVTQIDGGKLREGRTDKADLQKIVDQWGRRKGLPLIFNHSSTMRFSQLRALTIEAIRRYNVGLVIIDHFRYVDMDPPANGGRFGSQMEAEEQLARALKQELATALNVAVICLAHTTKAIEGREDRRPRLSDLRGSGQVAAHADYVAFVYRPYLSAKQDDIDDGVVKRTDAEMLWEKNRHSLEGTARFYFDPSTMNIY